MKITVDVDCTPEEARVFLGLPDLKPMQEALMAQLQERLSANLAAMDPETLVSAWLPSGVPGFEQFTKAIISQMDIILGREPRK